ncbi:MAG: hypothetical protein B7Z44_13720 [Caulobacter sp. 12-67-6]|nr:MAG: hypothetical protein B7Z44_13720 [Caulobacter sp. 12-67-6]OYX71387.1 MAG: hypothetical protein B7Y81_09185 [Caulobacter sp. 32-67-35]OYX95154.1 MAG: hypothetical protein B7Y78_05545 [Caulobacter sp. 35-67-4]OZA76624.1 MAG: hypothetical protein B7X77_05675 [Caulobacter sp. 39-67-4]HQR90229.1 hypothetical protein [Caulobacter sp.]
MEFPRGRLDLYLTEIGEPADNDLRIVVLQADARGPIESTEVGEARRIMPAEASPAIELVWYDYVAYAMRSESYARLEDEEPLSKDSFTVKYDSAFLTYVRASTFATDEFPGPLTHWSLDTLNHCLDVVSTSPPEVRVLDVAERPRGPTSQNWAKN